MNFTDYQQQAVTTLSNDHAYGTISAELMSQILGLVGESGEVAEKFKKLLRDNGGMIDETAKAEIAKELGDILWYVSSVSHCLDISLEDIAHKNLDKVLSRKARGVTKGSGDNR